jgi:hypothetical protein
MTGETSRRCVLPIARYPDPACSYDITDGTPVVRATNDAFDAQFGTDVAGTAVPEAFEQLGLRAGPESSELGAQLAREESFRVRAVESNGSTPEASAVPEEYLVETVPPGEEVGFLLFVGSPSGGDSTPGELGIDHVASVVSHDLRNPLDVARARLEAGRALDEDQHFDHVEQAH